MHRHFKHAALAAAVLSTFSVHAADESELTQVIVTATRFSQSALKTASNVTVITAEDIRNSPAINLPDVLKGAAGIDVRPLYGNMGIDATVDVRGFGDTASSNTLILLDGQRLNPIDAGGISWSAIPLNSIRRIEIIRGAGTVPYGDQASGGVINIITDKSGSPVASVTATGGSYGYRGADVNLAGGNEQAYFNVATHYADADGWRENSEMNQQSLSGRAGLHLSSGEAFLDFASYKDKSGLPGSLLSAAYQNNPTSARTPFDSQDRNGYRLRPGVSFKLSEAATIEADHSRSSTESRRAPIAGGSRTSTRPSTWCRRCSCRGCAQRSTLERRSPTPPRRCPPNPPHARSCPAGTTCWSTVATPRRVSSRTARKVATCRCRLLPVPTRSENRTVVNRSRAIRRRSIASATVIRFSAGNSTSGWDFGRRRAARRAARRIVASSAIAGRGRLGRYAIGG